MMNWPMVQLHEIGIFQSGFGFPNKMQGKRAGDYPFAKVGDISAAVRKGYTFISSANNYVDASDLPILKAKTLPVGSIVFAKIGEAIRQNFRAVTKVEMLIDNNAMGLIPKSDVVDTKYLYYFMCQLDLYPYTGATTVPSLRKSTLEKIKIPLPPLPIQRHIAKVLDQADQLCKQTEQMEAELNQLAQSVFLEMFGDPVKNLKGWETRKLSEFVEELQGGKSLSSIGDEEKTRNRVLKISAVTWRDFDPSASKPVSDDYEPPEDHFVRKGDLLFSRANTTELVGATSYVWGEHAGYLLPDKLWRFIWKEGSKLDVMYIWNLLMYPSIRTELGKLATGSGGSMKNISKVKLISFKVPFPPLKEQEKYGKFFRILNDRLADTRRLQTYHCELFQSLTQKAFKGEIKLEELAA